MKNSRILLALALCLPLALNAQEARNTALSFTRIDRNPRTSALAGAGLASMSGSAWSAFNNAAQISLMDGLGDVALGVQLWEMSNEADKTTNFAGGAAFCFGDFGVGIAGAYDKAVSFGGYTPNDRLVSLGLSYDIVDIVSVGVNARYAAQYFTPSAKVSGFSADISVIGRLPSGFTLALAVGNLGPKVKGSETSYGQPSYAKIGAAWNVEFNEHNNLEVLLDGEYNFGSTKAGAFAGALGVEYNFRRILFARAGYRLAGEQALIPSHLGVGIGLRYAGFRAEVSYLTASKILGNTLNIGLGYSF